MKLLVFSDNHRDRESLDLLLKECQEMDRIISLGDSEMREEELSERNVIGVKGNYPFEPNFPDDLIFIFDDWKFLFTHGHKYGVKMGLYRLVEVSNAHDIDVVCFGHTHRAILEEIDDLICMNPGSLTFPKGTFLPTYAIIETKANKISLEIRDLKTHKTLLSLFKTRRSHDY
ncbi:MAG: metallophosphoesterase [Firmicutes bacterium]|nr:metallophosphoesterase [Bacillota bacterium]